MYSANIPLALVTNPPTGVNTSLPVVTTSLAIVATPLAVATPPVAIVAAGPEPGDNPVSSPAYTSGLLEVPLSSPAFISGSFESYPDPDPDPISKMETPLCMHAARRRLPLSGSGCHFNRHSPPPVGVVVTGPRSARASQMRTLSS